MVALRLYSDDGQASPSEDMRLREAFAEFLRDKILRTCSKSHLSRYGTALGHWERLTDDPPVREIDDGCLQDFSDALLQWHHKRGFRGNENTRKILSYVESILRACCRRGDRNKRGQPGGNHLIEDMPVVLPPEKDIKKRRVAPLELIGRAYTACDAARWPRQPFHTPPALWRLLLVLNYNFGPRTEELLGLRWENIHWDPPCTADEIEGLEWPHGWLVYTPPKTKRYKPQPLHLPLTPCARLHLERMRPSPEARGPIFGFPRNKRDLHETRKAIWKQAGIANAYTFQELRKTCSTTWNDFRPGLGKHVTGHAPRGVNPEHYDTELRRLCRFAPQLPQPTEFLEAVGLDALPPASARIELASRLDTFSEETAALILKLADNICF